MIFYFSGTGNSEYVAKKIAEYTNDEARFIPRVFDEMQKDLDLHNEKIGVVFPIYAWQPPAIVMEFLEHVHASKKSFCYAIATCGESCGKAMHVLKKIFPFESAYSITMPENYIALFPLDEEERALEKINVARQRLPQIASEINAKKSVYDVDEGSAANFCTYVLHPIFSLTMLRSSFFSVDTHCVSCGECEKNCPLHVISFDGKKPVWNGKCQMCMSCIAKCPTHSIQCLLSRKKNRYVFEKFTTNKTNIKFTTNKNVFNETANESASALKSGDKNENVLTNENESAQKTNDFKNESASALESRDKNENAVTHEKFFELYSAYEFAEEKKNGAREKLFGKMRYFENATFFEIRVKVNERYELLEHCEYFLYAIKGRAKIVCDDESVHDFLQEDLVHSFGKAKSILNRDLSEFVCFGFKSE